MHIMHYEYAYIYGEWVGYHIYMNVAGDAGIWKAQDLKSSTLPPVMVSEQSLIIAIDEIRENFM